MDNIIQLPTRDAPFPASPFEPTQPLSPPPRSRPPRRGRRIVLAIMIVVVVLATGAAIIATIGTDKFLPSGGPNAPPPSTAPQIVGQLALISSGQVNEQSSEGIADQVQLDLSNVPAPATGKSYYAWLLGDSQVEGKALLLGALIVNNGAVHFLYTGDQHHSNLLEFGSSFLVTEEDASVPPVGPSPDKTTWRFTARFSTTPNPQDTAHHYSLLDHLRHLLASDPKLSALGLPGGINIWLFRNTQKILEYASSARDDWARQNTGLMHRQFVRILDYLDGTSYIATDVPPGTPIMIDPHIAQVGLLEFDVVQQDPPGYVYHVGRHLQGVVQSPDATAQQQKLADQIALAINKVQAALERVHVDAKLLVKLSEDQLLQPSSLTLLNDMLTQAQNAFVGQFDPSTNELQNGVTQIFYAIQRLTTLSVIVTKA